MEHPKAVGDRSQLAITLALIDRGFAVFLPVGENTRCDLVIDDGVQLGRVQCKTGRLREGLFASARAAITRITRTPRPCKGTISEKSITSVSIAQKPRAST
jgi:hypothetical protein